MRVCHYSFFRSTVALLFAAVIIGGDRLTRQASTILLRRMVINGHDQPGFEYDASTWAGETTYSSRILSTVP